MPYAPAPTTRVGNSNLSNMTSPLQDLLQALPDLHLQMYFKSSLTALSHAIEDLVLAGKGSPLVITNFQQERFYRQEVLRYRQIGQRTDQVYVLAVPEEELSLAEACEPYEIIPLHPNDESTQEWNLIVLGQQYAACLLCKEQMVSVPAPMEQARQFEGIWTFDRSVCIQAACLLLKRIVAYRPELAPKVEQAWQRYRLTTEVSERVLSPIPQVIDSEIFVQRLVTYLQANQYKLLKTYRAIALQERKERLINAITTAIRYSLNPQDVLTTAVQELGQTFDDCRCLLYRCRANDKEAQIEYEFVPSGLSSLQGETWSLVDNPLIQVALAQDRGIAIADITEAPTLQQNPALQAIIQHASIRSWLLVPIRYQGKLLGMLELHYGGKEPYHWEDDEIALVEAIATQAGVALTQAQAYTDLTTLNRQLESLERTQSNLIAIVGHELRTPLSTIRVCLESLATEPDMVSQVRQIMLETALADAERLRRLIQDFLSLSKLESGQVYRHPESIQLKEALDLALCGIKTRWSQQTLPEIKVKLPPQLPAVYADGEELVIVLTQLLDNACKFTDSAHEVTIAAQTRDFEQGEMAWSDRNSSLPETHRPYPMVEVIVADQGRGIEPSQLEAIFDRFYQEEGALRRTAGGTGLGLAICRRIVEGMGGKIWAESAGKERGSQFHFTVPIEALSPEYKSVQVLTSKSEQYP